MPPRTGSGAIFKDMSKLAFDYIPEKLLHRERELGSLFAIFEQVLAGDLPQRAFITGTVGTGKTALSKRFCLDLKERASSRGKALDFVTVNCRQRSTENSALLKIVGHFQPNFPDRGFSVPEMLEALRKDLEKSGLHLVVVLDEVDVLLKKSGSDLVYNLCRFDEERLGPKGRLSLILVSQKWALDMLDPATLSTIKRSNVVELGKYGQPQLLDIVRVRAELALQPGSVEDDVLELISDIAAEWGDARYAIELLERAGTLAAQDGLDSIGAEHVRNAKAGTHSVVTESKLDALERHEMLVLLASARVLRRCTYTTTGDAEKTYAAACEEYGEKARAHTQFWEYMKGLSAKGLLETKPSGKGTSGRTTLISLPDIPARELVEKLERMLARK